MIAGRLLDGGCGLLALGGRLRPPGVVHDSGPTPRRECGLLARGGTCKPGDAMRQTARGALQGVLREGDKEIELPLESPSCCCG